MNKFNIGITINFDINLYSNGLQQNIVFLNNLINDLKDFKSFYIYEGKKIDSGFIDNDYCFAFSDILKDDAIKFDLIIMMGLTMNENYISAIREKNKNTKFVLLQCGNQFAENMAYSLFEIDKNHSPIGNRTKIDQIWVLPHYEKNISFMKTYFKNNEVKIVPYIWDNLFINNQIENSIYKDKEINFSTINKKNILIMEPNLFYCKNCILPLFIVESFEHKHPNLLKKCNVLCADKIVKVDYFLKLVSQMDIYKKRKDFLKIQTRELFLNAIHKFGSILISHQQDNALNTLYFDALYLNIPLLHNSEIISGYGYYYPGNDIDVASNKLNEIIGNHIKNLEEYKKNCKIFLESYSSRNINIQIKYENLIRKVLNI